LPPTKSEKAGPALSLSVNLVGRTRGLWVGDSVAEGSVSVVAKKRDGPDVIAIDGKKILNGDGDDKPCRQRDLESLLAMTLDLVGGEGDRDGGPEQRFTEAEADLADGKTSASLDREHHRTAPKMFESTM
jgi:hypothetical protein